MDTRVRLAIVLSETAELLRSYAVEHWPERLEIHAANVRAGSSEAASDILGDFGGMGSLNNVWIDPRNGHRVAMDQEQSVNDRLNTLRSEIYQLSRAL